LSCSKNEAQQGREARKIQRLKTANGKASLRSAARNLPNGTPRKIPAFRNLFSGAGEGI
jgi:hypothetical protein